MSRKALIVCVALILAWGIRGYLIMPLEVTSGSMRPTLEPGDWIVIKRAPLARVNRGDIVVFRLSGLVTSAAAGEEFAVKRVIAVPGDTVVYDGTTVSVNSRIVGVRPSPTDVGNVVEVETPPWTRRLMNVAGPVIIETGHFFVVGDNFLQSSDSRAFGPISERSLVGRVAFSHWRARWLGRSR